MRLLLSKNRLSENDDKFTCSRLPEYLELEEVMVESDSKEKLLALFLLEGLVVAGSVILLYSRRRIMKYFKKNRLNIEISTSRCENI